MQRRYQMQAKDHSLKAVLDQKQQWVIPVYQRHYAWSTAADKQLPKLWEDIRDRAIESLEKKAIAPHFVGAIIYSEPTGQAFGTVNRRHLVDGQQRISTFSLFLCALREKALGLNQAGLAGAIGEFLFNPKSDGMADPETERFKLWSSSYDRPHYITIADGGSELVRESFSECFYKNGNLIKGQAPRMIAAYWFFLEEIENFIKEQIDFGFDDNTSIHSLLEGFLSGFQIVVVQLDSEDDPQSIFASLNGNAEPLSAFDLIRNDIFHRAREQFENEDALYEGNWKRLEQEFWKVEVKQGRMKRPRTDHLIAHTLVAEKAHEINVGQVANEYRFYARDRSFDTVQAEIASLLKYADVYEALEKPVESKPEFRISDFLSVWDISAFHPLVLWIGKQSISDETKSQAYKCIEDYILRRDICDLTRKNYNKVVPTLLRAIQESDDVVDALHIQMLSMEGETSRMPNSTDLKRAILQQPVYQNLGSKKLRYILKNIEALFRSRFDEDVHISTDQLTVEHVMPQTWAEHWLLPNGIKTDTENPFMVSGNGVSQTDSETLELMEQRNRLLHTFGNLTLVTGSLNPAMGNASWETKRDYLAKSLLVINRQITNSENWSQWTAELENISTWEEKIILARGQFLSEAIESLWPG